MIIQQLYVIDNIDAGERGYRPFATVPKTLTGLARKEGIC